MKEKLTIEDDQPVSGIGKFRIDLTDAITGKVVNRVEENNHVFGHMLNATGVGYDSWAGTISNLSTFLTNSTVENYNIPFILGNILAYGTPSMAGSGNYRGAYNSTNQVLAQRTSNSVRWKFQYDFTSAQGNGTIGTIGLSNVNCSTFSPNKLKYCPAIPSLSFTPAQCTSDGTKNYYCSTAGVVSIYDNLTAGVTTIDVSATVGTSSSYNKSVVYFMDTGKFGIISLQSSYLSSSDTKLYVFSNNTFSTRESTYNIGIKSNCYGYPISRACYGYGNNLIWPLDGPGYTYLPYLNYVSDGAIQTINLSVTPASSQFASNGLGFGYLARGTIPINPYLVAGLTGLYNSYSTSYGASAVVDLSTLTQVSQINAPINYDSNYPAIIDPTITDTTAIAYSAPLGNIRFLQYTGAVTSKKLDTPVVKTSANGMTVTYELEVFL